MRKTIILVLIGLLVCGSAPVLAGGAEQDRISPPRATAAAVQSPGELQAQSWLAWLAFGIIVYQVLFVPKVIPCPPWWCPP